MPLPSLSPLKSHRAPLIALALSVWFSLLGCGQARAGDVDSVLPAPRVDVAPGPAGDLQTVVFAGGCFWGVQAVFQHVKGVHSAISGYAGGSRQDAEYEIVSSGRTGHAESVQVEFDPAQVSYGDLLRVFFSVVHDPTELNRQGPDRGTQYRSAIFTSNEDQARVAKAYIAQLDAAKLFDAPIVTIVSPLHGFYRAEPYHQDYATKHPNNPYIAINDAPKVVALQRVYPEMYVAQPVLVSAR